MEQISVCTATVEVEFSNMHENHVFELSYNGFDVDSLKMNFDLKEALTRLALDANLTSGEMNVRVSYEKDGAYVDGDDYELYWDADAVELLSEWDKEYENE